MNQNIKLLNEILFAIITYSLAMIFHYFFFINEKFTENVNMDMYCWICISLNFNYYFLCIPIFIKLFYN